MSGSGRLVRIWSEVDSGDTVAEDFCGGQMVVFSQKCPTRGSAPNEDSALIIQLNDETGVLAVADGVGGEAAGNRASRCVADQMIEAFSQVDVDERSSDRGLRAEILDAIEAANQEILSWGIGAGATLIAVELSDDSIRPYHAGDSGVMLISNRGNVKFVTVGHAPVAQAIEIGLIHEEEGLVHEDRNLIDNCLGSTEMRIEIGPPVRMAKRDTLLLASDGLLDNLAQQEIATIVCKGNLSDRITELVNLAIDRMTEESEDHVPSKPDDLTVVAFRMT